MNDEIETQEYRNWIADLKRRYRATQVKAAVAVNSALIEYYWGLGRDISERYAQAALGNEFYVRVSADLKEGFPNVSGFSPQNLKYCSPPAISHRNTRCVDRAGKYFLEYAA